MCYFGGDSMTSSIDRTADCSSEGDGDLSLFKYAGLALFFYPEPSFCPDYGSEID